MVVSEELAVIHRILHVFGQLCFVAVFPIRFSLGLKITELENKLRAEKLVYVLLA